MKHFAAENLAEYARGMLSMAQAEEIKHHLDACEKCLKASEIWRAVVEIGQKEKHYQPTNGAIRRVEAAFRAIHNSKQLHGMQARLIFDSMIEALPVGVRNSMAASRQLQYEAGPSLIDIVLNRPGSESAPIFLTGQIATPDDSAKTVTGFEVFLLRGQRLAAQTMISDEGEFQFQIAAGKNWKLLFEREDGQVIHLSLPSLLRRRPKAGE
jgi:Putative zinc-finger